MVPIAVGYPELIALVVLVIVLFGAKKLPEISRSAGEAIREFRKATSQPPEKKQPEENKPDDKPE